MEVVNRGLPEDKVEGEDQNGSWGGAGDGTKRSFQMTDISREAVVNYEEMHTKFSQTEEGITRQSDRIKKQGLARIKIADKAQVAAKKKNLEDNNLNLKNSFAVLNNDALVETFNMRGGNTEKYKLRKF
jgi:uncharacterized protein YfeS